MSKKLTDVRGIGEKTAEKLRRRLSRPTGKLGSEVTVGEAARADAVTKSILAADQQRALSDEAISFNPERGARKETTSSRERTRSDTLTRGDFRVQKEAVKTARGEFEDLPEDKRSEDKSGREPVVTDVELWRENINQLDFPGVDTPRSPRVRAEPSDSVLNDTDAQRRPRENWQESQPEPTETQRRLGEEPEKADAERTGIYRASDGEFVERPLRPAGDGQFVSPNGQGVSQPLQDPTIGRDPDDGEFVDMPLATEPTVPLPDVGGAKGPSDVVGKFVQSGGMAESREIEFGGEQVDLTERDTDELEQMNSFLSRNIDAEVDAQRAKGGFGTSDFAQDYSEKQTEVALELDRRG
jgi:hypothetical protein